MKKSISTLEKALIASEIRYRRLFESAKDGILILDAETGMIVDVNPFLIKLLGYSKESFIEKTIWEIGFFKDIIDNKEKFLELQRDEYVRYEDLPLKTTDGRKINVEFVSNVYLVNNQKVIQCNIRDITERKETEAGLEKTRKELAEIKTIADEVGMFTESVINAVREPLLALDQDLRVVKASNSFYKFFKVSPEDTIGSLIYDLGNKQWDIPKLRELLEKILPKKTSFDNYEVEHNFSSIGTRIMLLNARQIKRGFGKEKIILLAFEDVTERKRKERSLSEKSRLNVEYLNVLLNHAHAPIITWDASLHIKRFNHEFEKLSGYSKSEVENKRIEMLFPKNEVASTLELIRSNIGDENPEVIEINILTKNKEIRTVLWNSANISDVEGKNTVATIAQDITGRKQSEKKLSNSEIRYRRLFEAAKDGILILDPETGMIVDVNLFLIKLLGYSKESFTEKPIWEIGLFKDIAQNKEKFLELQQNEYVRYEDLPLETSNGSKVNVEFISNVYSVNAHKVIQCNIRDITERKRGEEKEKELEAKYTKLYGSIRDAILVADNNRKIIDCNPAFTEMFGYSLDDIKNKKTNTIYENTKQFNELGQALKNHTTLKSPFLYTVNYKKKTGEVFPGETSVYYLTNLNDDITGFIGLIRDITDRKLAEDKLRESELRFKQVSENAREWIWEIDKNGLYTYASPVVKEILGYHPEEIVGKKHFYDLVEEYEKENYKQLAFGIFAQKINFKDLVNINRHKDGREIILSTSGVPILDDKAYLLGYRGVDVDITERKKLQANLSTAVEIAKLGYWEFDVKSENFIFDDQYYRIIHGSSTEKQGGNKMSAEEFAGRLVHPDDSKMVATSLQEAISSPDPEYLGRSETRVFRDNGDITTVMVQFKVIKDDAGRTIKVVGINQDITEQKRFEQELIIAKEKAEESDRLKSAFLANMSHEIRTPMNGILGFASLLKEPDLTGEEQQEYIKIIEKGGARMLNIISEIIDISKLESRQMEVMYKETNINKLIENIFNLLRIEAEDKKIKLSIKNNIPTITTKIKTDSEKVYSILTNLVKNAIKYTDKGSIEFGFKKLGNFLEFYVKDTGIGIPLEKQKVIFERFIQADILDIQARQGAGLGLTIAKALVELLGGKIWVESEEGKGSIFYFTIPFNLAPEAPNTVSQFVSPDIAMNKINDLKILIVEDDEISEMLISNTINKFGKEIIKAKTGNEAVEICKSNPDIDLILMDIRMPDLNGYEATRQIRKFNKDVVIIAQTAFALIGDREKALEAGCNDYISKPIKKNTIIEMIESHLLPHEV